MIEEKGRTCFDAPIFISIIWERGCSGRGKYLFKNVSTIEEFVLLATEMKRGANKKNG